MAGYGENGWAAEIGLPFSIFNECSHGSSGSYMNGTFNTADLFRLIAQQRVGITESCSVGPPGGITNHHIYTRGGGMT